MNQIANVVAIRNMTPEQYKREREQIIATLGKSRKEAAAKHDQAFAMLFHRAVYQHGWTQEQLAKAEGRSQTWVTFQLRFGAFLVFITTVIISEKVRLRIAELTEGTFRGYWVDTDKAQNDRQRFAQILKDLDDATLTKKRRIGLSAKILEKFADGKWHRIETIAAHVAEPPESLTTMLTDFGARNNAYGVQVCEKQKVGAKDGTSRYRIVRGGEKKIDLAALTQELSPILEELEFQGARHRAAYSPPAVLSCAHRIRKLLEALAQQAAPSR